MERLHVKGNAIPATNAYECFSRSLDQRINIRQGTAHRNRRRGWLGRIDQESVDTIFDDLRCHSEMSSDYFSGGGSFHQDNRSLVCDCLARKSRAAPLHWML